MTRPRVGEAEVEAEAHPAVGPPDPVVDDGFRQAGEDDEQPQPGLHRRVDASARTSRAARRARRAPGPRWAVAASTSSSGVTRFVAPGSHRARRGRRGRAGSARSRKVWAGVVTGTPRHRVTAFARPRAVRGDALDLRTAPRAGQRARSRRRARRRPTVGPRCGATPSRPGPRAAPPAPAAAASARVRGRRRRRGTAVGTPACAAATPSRRQDAGPAGTASAHDRA